MRKRARYGWIVFGCVLLGLAIATGILVRSSGPRAKKRVIEALQQRFDADVQLKSLHLTLFPQATAVGEGLTIRHKFIANPKPLISIRKFTAETDLFTLLFGRDKVRLLRLEDLQIHIPPKKQREEAKAARQQSDRSTGKKSQDDHTTHLAIAIQTMIADGATLEIESKDPDKPPMLFEIRKLTMHSVGADQPLSFSAQLTNAKPPGLIDSDGHFGPWQRDDPGTTPVSGTYSFKNANLGVFQGVSGTLSSAGKYGGTLERIGVDGTTDTPNFALKAGGTPVHLVASFHALVDGTNGDTILDPVDATFLNSEFLCEGSISNRPGEKGKTVMLDALTKHGRMEDILTLVLGDKQPFLKGDVSFHSKIEIPPGNQDVLEKLNLDGRFSILSAEFLRSKIQHGIEIFSERARGISKSEQKGPPDTVASDFRGQFKLDNGIATFSSLSFRIPGALVSLHGKYDLRSEKIDMLGTLRMQATLSQTQSGIKSWLLKPIDPFFKKDGAGFLAHISIGGTKSHPVPGLDLFGHHFERHRSQDDKNKP